MSRFSNNATLYLYEYFEPLTADDVYRLRDEVEPVLVAMPAWARILMEDEGVIHWDDMAEAAEEDREWRRGPHV